MKTQKINNSWYCTSYKIGDMKVAFFAETRAESLAKARAYLRDAGTRVA